MGWARSYLKDLPFQVFEHFGFNSSIYDASNTEETQNYVELCTPSNHVLYGTNLIVNLV